VCLVGLVGCRGWESEKPPVHLIANMDTQEKVKAYRKDTTGLFADGRSMQAPVEGTVALGQLDEDDTYFKGTDEKGEFVIKLPAAIKAQIDSLPAGWCAVGVTPIASTLGAAADMAESAGRARGRDAMMISIMKGISQDLKRLGIEKMIGTSYATEKGLRTMMRW